MTGAEMSRFELLYLLRFLKEQSDDEHGVTMKRILGYFDNQGIPAERKSIYRDIPPPEDFNIDNYIKNEFGMYTGETVTLDIRLTNNLINPLMDCFGTSTPVHRNGSDHIIAHVQAAISPVFYSCLFQFGENVQIVKPARIAEEYKKMVKEVLEGMG